MIYIYIICIQIFTAHCQVGMEIHWLKVERDNYCIFCWTPVANMSAIWGISGSFQGFPISTAQWTSSPSRVHFPCCKQKTIELRVFYMCWFSLWIHQKKNMKPQFTPRSSHMLRAVAFEIDYGFGVGWQKLLDGWLPDGLVATSALCPWFMFWFPWIAEDCVKCIEML